MPIKKYFATADNAITNKFDDPETTTRNTGSNAGFADTIEVFSFYGRKENSAGAKLPEIGRSLIQFPISKISSDRAAGIIPGSGSVTFKLKMYNAKHFYSVPYGYDIEVAALTASWEEGIGIDLQEYSDITEDQVGSNWMRRSAANSWTRPGGDFYSDASSSFTQTIENGPEDLDINITPLVEQWVNSAGNVLGSKTNYGMVVKLHGDFEPRFDTGTGADETGSTGNLTGVLINTTGSQKSYYIKMFFGRASEFYYKRPVIEAQFNSSVKDDRNKFYISSSVKQTFSDNLNRLYFYNNHNGNLIDIRGATNQLPTVSLYYSSGSVPEGTARGFLNSSEAAVTQLTAVRQSTGIYYADVAVTGGVVNSTYPYLIDVWSYGGEQILTGSAITPLRYKPNYLSVKENYVLAMPNLLPEYKNSQIARMRLYVRNKKWSPNIYTTAKSKPESLTVVSGSYRILRAVDDYEVQPHGTGSVKYSELSYDGDGNYFDIDMSNYEVGYQYIIKFAFYDQYTAKYQEQPYRFKFRVVD